MPPPVVPAPAAVTTAEKEALETSTPTKVNASEPASDAALDGNYMYGSVSSHPFRTLFAGLLFFGAGVGLFMWCGGMKHFRRAFKGKGKYRRVGDEDLEK